MQDERMASISHNKAMARDGIDPVVIDDLEKSSTREDGSKEVITVASGSTDEIQKSKNSPKIELGTEEICETSPRDSSSIRYFPFNDGSESEDIIVLPETEVGPSGMVSRLDSDEGVVFLVSGSSKQKAKFKINKHRIKKIMANGGDETATYPADCYTLMSLYGPKSAYFWFGFLVFAFQMTFLLLMLMSITNSNWKVGKVDDNPWEGMIADFIATEADPLLRGTQFISLLTFILFADSSMLDIITAVHTFPNFSLATKDDKIWCMVTSCILRFVQGGFATFVAFFLVFTSGNVIDVILNFTALNFISALDEVAFEFAKSGKYGQRMEKKIEEIEELPLPVCMYRKHKHVRFWFTIIPILIIGIGSFIYIAKCQDSLYRWETHKFRIQMSDPKLKPFNGCYHNDFDDSTDILKRDLFTSDTHNEISAKFGFCSDTKQWVLYIGDSMEPCNAPVVIHSASTDFFDISTSFLDNWFNSEHVPTDLYFFDDDYKGDNLYCDQFLNNGICDKDLNLPFHNYDSGDCCASTCTLPDCEVGGLVNAFGSTNTSGDGYADCIDPDMVPVRIHLHGFKSSHDPDIVSLTDEDREYIEAFMPDYFTETPIDTLLSLYCNSIKVLKYYVNESMENQNQTVMVEDGASCRIRIENSTSTAPHWEDAALWYMNYTVYQGRRVNPYLDINPFSDKTPVRVVQSSREKGEAFFQLVPTCYSDIFKDHFRSNNTVGQDGSIQTRSLKWILQSGIVDKNCLNGRSILSRYALGVLNFAAPISSSIDDGLWIEGEKPDLCNWKNVVCSQNENSTQSDILHLDIAGHNLLGSIPTEVGLLSTLIGYDASNNTLTGSLPNEIWDVKLLSVLNLGENYLTGSIPKDVGQLTLIEEIFMEWNQLTGSIPSEIGLLTNLNDLSLGMNLLDGSIPSVIGLLTSLDLFRVGGNKLTGTIPSEIGLLTALTVLELNDNDLTGPIPSEIGLLTALERLRIANNSLTGAIPSEIGYLTSLTILEIDKSNVPNSIPTEMEGVPALESLFMGDFR